MALVQDKVTKSHEWLPQALPINGDPTSGAVHFGALHPLVSARTDAANPCQKETFPASAPSGRAREVRRPCRTAVCNSAGCDHEWLPLEHPMDGDLSARDPREAEAPSRLRPAGQLGASLATERPLGRQPWNLAGGVVFSPK